jgi:hypothetical protein
MYKQGMPKPVSLLVLLRCDKPASFWKNVSSLSITLFHFSNSLPLFHSHTLSFSHSHSHSLSHSLSLSLLFLSLSLSLSLITVLHHIQDRALLLRTKHVLPNGTRGKILNESSWVIGTGRSQLNERMSAGTTSWQKVLFV